MGLVFMHSFKHADGWIIGCLQGRAMPSFVMCVYSRYVHARRRPKW